MLDGQNDMFTQEQYESALRELGRGIREGQRRMLAAHANAPGGLLDVSELAATAGQSSDNFTYAQYGALGHMIAAAIDPMHDEDVWTRVIGDGSRDPDTGMVQWRIHPALASAVRNLEWVTDVTLLSGSADVIPEPSDLVSPTVREALVELRLTQGEFRTLLIRYWGGCAVTGCAVLEALTASHIKPWCDSSNQERRDPFNGLLLLGTLDRLFDTGLISFEDDGIIKISAALASTSIRKQLNLSPNLRLRRVDARHAPYLSWHRQRVFLAAV